MFTCIFEGATSSRAELYYNNIQDEVLIPSTPIYTKYVYQNNHLVHIPANPHDLPDNYLKLLPKYDGEKEITVEEHISFSRFYR
jgi:hypothetical protein